MSYATLMLHLQIDQSNAGLLRVAATLAEQCHAALIGIAAAQPMPMTYGEGYVPAAVLDEDRQEIQHAIDSAEAEFRAALQGRVATLQWRSAITYLPLSKYLAQEARCADCIITGVDANASVFDNTRHVDIGDLVMQAGRPVLIVPQAVASATFERVLVAWKDTREARRAVYDALPLLRQAAHVTVVEVAEADAMDAARSHLADVSGWLASHGVAAASVAYLAHGEDAHTLEDIAAEHRADLLVAGAYGHSRVREWALGGVTRDLLLRAERCALVSH